MDISGSGALVVGGASGLGEETARGLGLRSGLTQVAGVTLARRRVVTAPHGAVLG